MRRSLLLPITGLVLISGCDSPKKPSDANFAAAINQYLAKHGQTCTVINRQFPIDVPRPERREPYGIGAKMEALTQAGLVNASDTTTVVHGMIEPLQGPSPPQPVRHYELTLEGKKYLKQVPGDFGPTDALCYGQKTVDSIIKWTEPTTVRTFPLADVTYSYKIANLAAWASRPDIQEAFPDVKATVIDVPLKNQMASLELTNKGWAVPGS